MKFLLDGVLLLACLIVSAQETNKIIILGTYHMANPGLDVNNLESDDVLAPKRQKEILEIISQLTEFNPTKVAIESKYQSKYDTLNNANYGKYLKGDFELTSNETHQIAFRLAKEAGHSQLYALDAKGKFDFDAMTGYAQSNGQMGFLQEMQAWMGEFMEEEQEFMDKNSVKDILLRMNEDERLKAGHSMYIKMLEVGKNTDYPGSDIVTDWHERNFKIFSNILRVTENSGERMILLIGAGHAPILRDLVRYHPDWELVEVSEYLK